jgi:hypothetical protein
MKKLVWLLLLACGCSETFSQDFYITWNKERVPCKIRKTFINRIHVKATDKNAEDGTLKANEIMGFRKEGVVVFSKKIVNSEDSSYIFLPSKKPHLNYKYSKDVRVNMRSNGAVTFYEMAVKQNRMVSMVPGMGPAGMPGSSMQTTTTKYRFFLENDGDGLNEIILADDFWEKKKAEVYELLKRYFKDNPETLKQIEEEKDTRTNKRNIEKIIWDYFQQGAID